ncbi:MAG: MBL fold metallo-hydrolase, partial [Actinobacteria bacterium]|nr:MBL fold metallo-hydrolase [Actinomycetota bacterium]
MPEGHLLHRLARDQQELVGKELAATSPQGRFAEGAAALDGRSLLGVEAYGKHLHHRYDTDRGLHVHLGMQGKWLRLATTPPRPQVRLRLATPALAWVLIAPSTCALIDDRLLVDLGPDGPRAALRQGVDLRGVEAVLVTHAHPDHHAWPAWMWRGWAEQNRPLTLIAPPAVLDAARPHLDPTVEAIEVSAGDRLHVAGYDVVAVPATHAGPAAGPAVLYDLTGPDGTRILWATDTGVLSAAALDLVADRAYDAVLLDLTSAHLPDHHDLRTWPEQVDELRR